jgi:predicted metal-binding protein
VVRDTNENAGFTPVELLVCKTCRKTGQEKGDGDDPRPGAVLAAALTAADLPDGVILREVACMSNCSNGCTVALRGGAMRYSYVYGNLDPAEHLETLIDGVTRYRDAADGLVPWRERPEHFKRNCIARIPPLETKND